MSLSTVFGPLLRALTGGYRAAPWLGTEWEDVRARLGLREGVFEEVAAAGSLHPHFHYRHFTKPKKDGGRREIVEPDVKLKQVQWAIAARYFPAEQAHPAAVAYRKQKSIADHVWPHAGAELLITADVADFFPATQAGRVEDWWRERVPDRLARLLTVLTTYRGGLPQGAPTSPPLSNFLNRELDERLAGRAQAAGASYTRYCDDMVFSWRRELGPPSDFEAGVRAALHEIGYTLHPRKGWQVHDRRDEPVITGVVLTRYGGVRLPDHLRRAKAALTHSDDPGAAARLQGYLGYEAMIRKRPRRRGSRPKPVGETVRRQPPCPPSDAETDGDSIPF
jgi:hypothetical protein